MYWILIEKELESNEVEQALSILFPRLKFHHIDQSVPDAFANPFFYKKDGKNLTYSISKWNQKLKTRIDFHDLNEGIAIPMTQYIGWQLSKSFETKAVTDYDSLEDMYIHQYRSLLIEHDQLKIIDDDGIEFDNYEYKILADYAGEIKIFDENGCL